MSLNVGLSHPDEATPQSTSNLGEFTDNSRIAALQAELEGVRSAQFMYNSVLRNAPLVISSFDTDGIFTLSEGKGLEALGMEPGAAVGLNIFEAYADSPDIVAAAKNALRGEPQSYQTFVLNRYHETQMQPILDADGKVTGVLSISKDITERYLATLQRETQFDLSRALTRVHTMDEFLQTAVKYFAKDNISSAVLFLLDKEPNVAGEETMTVVSSWYAPNIYEMLPVGSSISSGDEFTQLWINDPSNVYFVGDVLKNTVLTQIARDGLVQVGTNAFLVIPLKQADDLLGIIMLTWPEPREFGALERANFSIMPSIFSPVAESVRLIETLEENVKQLERARRIAQENARLKSEFLATMSHELRTPLNAIEGFTSIILNNMGGATYNDKTARYVSKVETNSKRLLALINDFLDLSRIESGRIELASLPFSPALLANKWRTDIGVLAERKGLTFDLDVETTIPDTLYGDEEAISKVVINLLSNAIKFTETGGVALKMAVIDSEWVVSVTDTGIGIPPHATEYIFDEFRQVDQTSKRRFGGTGLGLSIVHKLIRAMGGKVTVQSVLGEGSTFVINLPLNLNAIKTQSAEASA